MWLLEEFSGVVANFVGAEICTFARMSGMLDLSRDGKVACLSRLNVLKQGGEFVKGIAS